MPCTSLATLTAIQRVIHLWCVPVVVRVVRGSGADPRAVVAQSAGQLVGAARAPRPAALQRGQQRRAGGGRGATTARQPRARPRLLGQTQKSNLLMLTTVTKSTNTRGMYMSNWFQCSMLFVIYKYIFFYYTDRLLLYYYYIQMFIIFFFIYLINVIFVSAQCKILQNTVDFI